MCRTLNFLKDIFKYDCRTGRNLMVFLVLFPALIGDKRLGAGEKGSDKAVVEGGS